MAVTIPNAPPPDQNYVEDFYVYNAATFTLAPGAVLPVNIQIQADSDFKLIKLAQFCANNASLTALTESTRPLPLINMQLTDTGSGRQLFTNPVPLPALFGDGRLPFILPIVRIFKARATIQLNFTSYDSAITYRVDFALIGTKLFYS